MTRIADLTWKHPKLVLAAVGVFTLLAFALSKDVQQHLKAAGFNDPHGESAKAQDLLIEKTGSDAMPGIVVRVTPPAGETRLPLRSPALRKETKRLTAELLALEGVARVEDPLSGGSAQLIAPDRRSLLINAYFSSGDAEVLTNAAEEASGSLESGSFDVTVGGIATGFNEANHTIEHDLVRAELIAFPLLALLLLIVFRGVVAASIPLVVGMVSVGGTFLALLVMSEFVDTSVFALNITTAMGLGLAVDYGLLMVTRYREELERDGASRESHRRLVESAGRTVIFSGLTVASALAALTLLPQRFLYSLGAGGAIVAMFAAFGALLVVPAMLALLGERVNALSLRRGPAVSDESGGWYRLARGVMRRPVAVALSTSALLLLLAVPVLGVKLTFPGTDNVPEGEPSREVVVTINRDYPTTLGTPIPVVVDGPASRAQLRNLSRRIGTVEGIATPVPFRRVAPDLAVANFGLRVDADHSLDDESQDTVRAIRALNGPAPTLVSGYTAEFLDLKASLGKNLPLVIAVITLT
ncbi:MAG TPA: MMPL family transporter, partial [Solirubrobacterales bacterium]|nr:MMPL family transporter [Solirubrobacterales bacterium]